MGFDTVLLLLATVLGSWYFSYCVTIPPVVGPTWSRVAYSLGSDYVLVLSQRTCLVMWCLGRHVCCLIHSHWLCVMCPSLLPLPAHFDSTVIWGCTSTSTVL